jgi:peptidoglycan L-alanyl-D-glutamate endopeptidase CwlK
MTKLTARSEAHLAKLKPEFAALVRRMLELGIANGMRPEISSSLRTPEEQDALYAQGRDGDKRKRVTNARRWQSMHNYGLAVDLFFVTPDGKGDWSPDKFATLWALAEKAGLDRKGLFWSGLWTGSLRESAHYQMGRTTWQDVAKEHGIDPYTLQPLKKV